MWGARSAVTFTIKGRRDPGEDFKAGWTQLARDERGILGLDLRLRHGSGQDKKKVNLKLRNAELMQSMMMNDFKSPPPPNTRIWDLLLQDSFYGWSRHLTRVSSLYLRYPETIFMQPWTLLLTVPFYQIACNVSN